jgi:hypothetical protein
VARAVVLNQIRDDLADDRAELEAVAGAGRDQQHPPLLGVAVDHEVLVRGVGEEADPQPDRLAGGGREVALRRLPQQRLVGGGRLALHRVRVDRLPRWW